MGKVCSENPSTPGVSSSSANDTDGRGGAIISERHSQLIFHFGGGPEGFDEGETAITEPLEARHRLSTQEYAVCAL